MNAERYNHAAIVLQNGQVLVTGGVSNSKHGMSDVEFYDPTTGYWSQTGSMIMMRESHPATLLLNGKVLVTGGDSATNYLGRTAELYDQVTKT